MLYFACLLGGLVFVVCCLFIYGVFFLKKMTELCSFAHGHEELRVVSLKERVELQLLPAEVLTKYRTEVCKNWRITRTMPRLLTALDPKFGSTLLLLDMLGVMICFLLLLLGFGFCRHLQVWFKVLVPSS